MMTEPTTHAPRVTSHTYEGDGAPCTAEAYGETCGAPRDVHELDEGHAPLLPEREQEIRETHPGEWYDGPWTHGYVDSNGDEPAYCRVVHQESGTVLATLPDFAGPIALFIADAHDAVPELLAELDRVRAERDRYVAELERLNLEHWEDQPIRGVLDEIHAERCRQNEKWGEQNHPDVDPRDIPYVTHGYYASRADIWRQVNEERAKPSRSLGRCTGHPEGPHTHTAWDGVLLEEVYEALAEEDPARLRAELIQVAAVAVAWVEAINRRAAAPAEESSGQ